MFFCVACAFFLERAVIRFYEYITFFAGADIISLWLHGVIMAVVAFKAAHIVVLLVRFVIIASEFNHIDIIVIADASFGFFVIGRVIFAFGALAIIAELVIGTGLSAAETFAIGAGHAFIAGDRLSIFFAFFTIAAWAIGFAFRVDAGFAIIAFVVAASAVQRIFCEIDAIPVAKRAFVAFGVLTLDFSIYLDIGFSAAAFPGGCFIRVVWAVIYGDQFFVGASHA